MHMVKVISLANDAYEMLKKEKKEGESFSVTVRRLLKKKAEKKDIMDFAGIWKDRPEMDRIFAEILERRHKGSSEE